MKGRRSEIVETLSSALLWVAAFCFATGIFFCATLLLRYLPPTEPVAIGRVTIERASKLKDYLGAALFFLMVPPLAVWLRGIGERIDERLRLTSSRLAPRPESGFLITTLFAAPFILSPIFHLTTNKIGWVLGLPLGLSFVAPRLLLFYRSRRWLRRLFRPELAPHNLLICLEGVSWLVFRYIATGRRIAHINTLFLESVFFLFFVALFWAAFVLIARLATMTLAIDEESALQRVAAAGLPFVALPLMSLWLPPPLTSLLVVLGLFAIGLAIALRSNDDVDGTRLRRLATLIVIPLLLYCVSYASTANLSAWLDLFHRGETLGPASDYLRGSAPYRDVFVLHGLLEDGLLDAWMMEIFGRRVEVALVRPVILGSLLAPALWFIGLAIFDSVPLALLAVMLGAWTTAENSRTFYEVIIVALILHAIGRSRRPPAFLAGLIAGVTLFVSLDIGLYSIVGGVVAFVAVAIATRRGQEVSAPPRALLLFFVAGVAAGVTPFLVYLGLRGVVGDFVTTSFVTIPGIIDAVWSLPFPDLIGAFRKDLNLHVIAEFILFEKFHMILSFLVIGIALIYLAYRWVQRRIDRLDIALLVLTIFAAITQRTALGRVEFRHQYFAAFLIGPMLVILGVLIFRRARLLWYAGDDGGRAFLVSAAVLGLTAFSVLFWVPDLVNARIDDLLRYQARRVGHFHDPKADAVRFRIHDVGYVINELTRPGEPIFDFSNQPAFYYFADRPNATRFYQVPILSPPRLQRETIVALERTKPKAVLRRSPELYDQFDEVPNDVRAQAVAAYLDDYYQFYRSARGVEIWRRKEVAPKADVEAYLRHIRLPTAKELTLIGARSRLVFPTIGSIPGANASYWKSDLTLHNPHPVVMPLSLRYAAGEIRIDRRIQLGANHSISWPDVVKTLFQAPDSRGVLWIEYRGERGPMARVKTYDASRGAGGSVESPLSLRDSATGNSEWDDLTLAGLPGGGRAARRVNVGVVNIGDIPGTFRITARTRQGREVGTPFEVGIPEDDLFLLPDVEETLRTQIDESVTVHVRIIAGTCIAFATIVETDGDNQLVPAVPSPRR